MNIIINLYISIWSALAIGYLEKIPKPKYTLNQEYKAFVRYDQNTILLPYQESSFNGFHVAMENLIAGRQQKLNVVHIGDSHIQADYFSGQVRTHFNEEDLLGNGGRGYFFPASMAKSQNAFNLKVSYVGNWQGCKNVDLQQSCSWGLGGMTATSYDQNAQFTIDPNSRTANSYPISKIRIYYPVDNPNSFYINLITPQGLVAPNRLNADGYAEFYLDEPQKSVTFQLEKKFAHQNVFVLEGIALSNHDAGVQYHAVGVNGATVYSFLKAPKLEKHLQSLNPNLVIISLGTNDAYSSYFDGEAFKLNYARLIQRIKAACPQSSILLTTPADCALPGGIANPSNKAARQKIIELAEESDCAVWDLFTIMGGFGSSQKWFSNQLSAADRVHFTKKGYDLQGDLLYDALIQNYAEYCLLKAQASDMR
ncbi:MAG: GDSL-type esterase/lipase family protein [Microscillaceae bacterium]|nr:GDSL-type esterase/lipase family protein [Microscillaceae bacterium]